MQKCRRHAVSDSFDGRTRKVAGQCHKAQGRQYATEIIVNEQFFVLGEELSGPKHYDGAQLDKSLRFARKGSWKNLLYTHFLYELITHSHPADEERGYARVRALIPSRISSRGCLDKLNFLCAPLFPHLAGLNVAHK